MAHRSLDGRGRSLVLFRLKSSTHMTRWQKPQKMTKLDGGERTRRKEEKGFSQKVRRLRAKLGQDWTRPGLLELASIHGPRVGTVRRKPTVHCRRTAGVPFGRNRRPFPLLLPSQCSPSVCLSIRNCLLSCPACLPPQLDWTQTQLKSTPTQTRRAVTLPSLRPRPRPRS